MSTASFLDNAPLTRFHKKLLLQSAGGPFLDGYLLSIIGIALVGMTPELRLSTSEESLAGAAALIGIFIGGMAFGRVTDRIGRQLMYTVDLIALVVASALCVFVNAPWQLILLRLIIGIAIGADYPIATALLAEWLPAKKRGAMLGSLVVFWFIGATVATFVGFAMSAVFGDASWRFMLGSAIVPGAVILLMRIGTPESPRWLISKGRVAEAQQVVRSVFGDDVDLTGMAREEAPAVKQLGFKALLRGQYLRRTFFCGFFYLAAVTPLFAMYTFGPQILGSFGLGEGNMSNLGYTLISLLFLLGCLPALRWTETMGRRPLLIWSFVAMLAPMIILAVAPSGPAPLVIGAFAFYALASGGPNILEWSYPNEIFPTEIRATAMGVVTAVSRIGAAIGTFLLPLGLDSIGTGPTMMVAAGLTAAGLIVSMVLAPETKNRSLAEASAVTSSRQTPSDGSARTAAPAVLDREP
ncbi:metabolite transporter [Sinomonas atrocyanea]|uniref:Metabolite transporter n=2 Tax=Sinomonas atrocyanea TaxID=37927 RepID=A0A127A6P8_9MICC|nr:MFS transporter [Sinomonas atrocyanea]AMM34444.1 metabolite transporter [Sinomonas atrocyanea]GEB65832.1 MFS transporter [Sinomonas atrocyanea]GGG61105.1 MFS transporter [Sinomonas atrocyanea]